jgi:hypothetical protein
MEQLVTKTKSEIHWKYVNEALVRTAKSEFHDAMKI